MSISAFGAVFGLYITPMIERLRSDFNPISINKDSKT